MLQRLALFAKRQRTLPFHWRGLAAAAEPALAEDSPFLRFGSIVPQATNHAPIMATVPETKVGSERQCTMCAMDYVQCLRC